MSKVSKVLRASTIIADKFYIERAADRQLDAIIEDMGRPGYVLVARQMGKTNLLLKMKRDREAQGDLVLYFDLSARFRSARDLFRYIVDGLLERLAGSEVSNIVSVERAGERFEANAEFDRHIRLALAACEAGRIIVVLDEIDSLIGRDYSDRILSQIRSMYFARATYPIYERMTYVLSGVAEPTDLIKDKNISPFNIGEKIYLDDFSLNETSNFNERCGLDFSREIVESVFEWAAGNPRMTWDIFSGLEDVAISGEVLTPPVVERVVRHLYLTRFDRPPVDHIRALAESDAHVCSALLAIHADRADELDDAARSKLYLSGITSAQAYNAPRIKNRIIAEALSEGWLRTLQSDSNKNDELSRKEFEKGNYETVVELLESEGVVGEAYSDLTDFELYHLILAYYNLSRHSDVIRVASAALGQLSSQDLRESVAFNLASAYVHSGQYELGLEQFKAVAEQNGTYRLQALQAQATALLALSIEINSDEIVALSESVINEAKLSRRLAAKLRAELVAVCHYNLALVYESTGDTEKCQSSIWAAVQAIDQPHLPGLASLVIGLISEPAQKRRLLNDAAAALLELKPHFSRSPSAFELKLEVLGRLMATALELKANDEFMAMLDFAREALGGNTFEALSALALPSAEDKTSQWARRLLKHAITQPKISGGATQRGRLEVVRALLVEPYDPFEIPFIGIYMDEIDSDESLIIPGDLIGLTNRLAQLMRWSQRPEITLLIDFIERHEKRFIEIDLPIFVLFLQHAMVYWQRLDEVARSQDCARKIMRHLAVHKRVSGEEGQSRYENLMKRVREAAQNTLVKKNDLKHAGVGRNTVVLVRDNATGISFSAKFKHIERKMLSGEVEFVRAV